MVLGVVAFLSVAIMEFDASTRRQLREATIFRDELKAMALAMAGVAAARAILQEDAKQDKGKGVMTDSHADLWGVQIQDYPIGDGIISIDIQDEQGKFNVNDLSKEFGVQSEFTKRDQFARLLKHIPIQSSNRTLIGAVGDWIDADDSPTLYGAESTYYQTQWPPYQTHNHALGSVDELHLIKGFTDDIVRQLKPYLTVYPYPPNRVVNINTASLPVLVSLHPSISNEVARTIMRKRPFRTKQSLDRVSGMEQIAKELRLKEAYDVRSEYFGVLVKATVNKISRVAKAIVRRKSEALRSQGDILYLRIE